METPAKIVPSVCGQRATDLPWGHYFFSYRDRKTVVGLCSPQTTPNYSCRGDGAGYGMPSLSNTPAMLFDELSPLGLELALYPRHANVPHPFGRPQSKLLAATAIEFLSCPIVTNQQPPGIERCTRSAQTRCQAVQHSDGGGSGVAH
jgi:hypothetical protein